jgi:hypothetical protein
MNGIPFISSPGVSKGWVNRQLEGYQQIIDNDIGVPGEAVSAWGFALPDICRMALCHWLGILKNQGIIMEIINSAMDL